MYFAALLNLLYHDGLDGTPLQALTGQMPDISVLLQFHFWEPVYYATSDVLSYNSSPQFPSASLEGKGHFVGFSKNVGDALTYKIRTDDTNKVIYRSAVRSALTTDQRNLRIDPVEGETPKPIEIIKSPRRSPILGH